MVGELHADILAEITKRESEGTLLHEVTTRFQLPRRRSWSRMLNWPQDPLQAEGRAREVVEQIIQGQTERMNRMLRGPPKMAFLPPAGTDVCTFPADVGLRS